jgi:ribonuclease HI
MLTLRFDGLFRSVHHEQNPNGKAGVMCYGWVIYRGGKAIARGHGAYARGCDANANLAEYLALIAGMQGLLDMGVEGEAVTVIGDARSVIDQMMGVASVSSAQVRPLHARACRLARHFRSIEWRWQPRRDNHAADQLTRRALRQVRREPGDLAAAAGPNRRRLTALLDLCVFV